MELRHLRYFVAVAEELHFGRAAARLNMAQPPLSQQIRQLEKELGVLLLARNKHSVTLTEAGRIFLAETRRTLAQADRAVHVVRQAERGEVGHLVIGFISSATYSVFPDILRSFRMRYPQIEVVLDESTTERQLQALHDNKIDLGFLRAPIEDKSLKLITVVSEPIVAAVSDFHPLARAHSIELRQLAGEPFISLPRKLLPGYYDYIAQACRKAGFELRIAQEALQVHTIISLVAAGMGVALVPASLRKAQRKGVRFLDLLPPITLQTEIDVAYRADNRSNVLRSFIEVVQAASAAQ